MSLCDHNQFLGFHTMICPLQLGGLRMHQTYSAWHVHTTRQHQSQLAHRNMHVLMVGSYMLRPVCLMHVLMVCNYIRQGCLHMASGKVADEH